MIYNTTSLGTLTIKTEHAASPHCYIYRVFPPFVHTYVTWHIAMVSARAHINNSLYCGPTVQPMPSYHTCDRHTPPPRLY